MIKNRIEMPADISSDTVFQIIEMYYAGSYKLKRESDSKLRIKRLYTYQSSIGWNKIIKKLNFNDSGLFQINDNYLYFKIDLTLQIVFWTLMPILGLLMLWGPFHVPFTISVILIFVPLIIGWVYGLFELKQFIRDELNMISRRLK